MRNSTEFLLLFLVNGNMIISILVFERGFGWFGYAFLPFFAIKVLV